MLELTWHQATLEPDQHSDSDMSSKGYFMRQIGSYEIYKASNSSTVPPGGNPHSLA